jgi:hypothetical protein
MWDLSATNMNMILIILILNIENKEQVATEALPSGTEANTS